MLPSTSATSPEVPGIRACRCPCCAPEVLDCVAPVVAAVFADPLPPQAAKARTHAATPIGSAVLVSGFMGVLPKLILVPATNTNITIVTHDTERSYVVEEMFKDTHIVEIT